VGLGPDFDVRHLLRRELTACGHDQDRPGFERRGLRDGTDHQKDSWRKIFCAFCGKLPETDSRLFHPEVTHGIRIRRSRPCLVLCHPDGPGHWQHCARAESIDPVTESCKDQIILS